MQFRDTPKLFDALCTHPAIISPTEHGIYKYGANIFKPQWIHSGYAPFIYPQNSFPYKLIDSSTIYYCIHNYLYIYQYIINTDTPGTSSFSRKVSRGPGAQLLSVVRWAMSQHGWRIGGFHQWIPKNGCFFSRKSRFFIYFIWMDRCVSMLLG